MLAVLDRKIPTLGAAGCAERKAAQCRPTASGGAESAELSSMGSTSSSVELVES